MARQVLEAIVDGILIGGVYALMAVGLTLIFGVLDIINIAQGVLVVLGAYLSYALSVHLHVDLFAGLLVTVPVMFVIGVAIHVAFIRPLRGRERTSMSLLACYAVAIIIDAFIVRTVLVPALMHMSGNANWWLPTWLDRALLAHSFDGRLRLLALREIEDERDAFGGPAAEHR